MKRFFPHPWIVLVCCALALFSCSKDKPSKLSTNAASIDPWLNLQEGKSAEELLANPASAERFHFYECSLEIQEGPEKVSRKLFAALPKSSPQSEPQKSNLLHKGKTVFINMIKNRDSISVGIYDRTNEQAIFSNKLDSALASTSASQQAIQLNLDYEQPNLSVEVQCSSYKQSKPAPIFRDPGSLLQCNYLLSQNSRILDRIDFSPSHVNRDDYSLDLFLEEPDVIVHSHQGYVGIEVKRSAGSRQWRSSASYLYQTPSIFLYQRGETNSRVGCVSLPLPANEMNENRNSGR